MSRFSLREAPPGHLAMALMVGRGIVAVVAVSCIGISIHQRTWLHGKYESRDWAAGFAVDGSVEKLPSVCEKNNCTGEGCYRLQTQALVQLEAQTACSRQGMQLAEPRTKKEINSLYARFRTSTPLYIGLAGPEWRWMTEPNKSLGYFNFRSNDDKNPPPNRGGMALGWYRRAVHDIHNMELGTVFSLAASTLAGTALLVGSILLRRGHSRGSAGMVKIAAVADACMGLVMIAAAVVSTVVVVQLDLRYLSFITAALLQLAAAGHFMAFSFIGVTLGRRTPWDNCKVAKTTQGSQQAQEEVIGSAA